MTVAKISRNALCPCGSGKKFKHCCLRARSAAIDSRVLPPSPPRRDTGTAFSFVPRQAAPRPAIGTPLEKRDWQEFHVSLDEPTGDQVCAVLLYSREWLRSRNVVPGGPIQLYLPPYDVRGEGRVGVIEPATTIPEGEGMVVAFARRKQNPEEASLPLPEKRDWQQVHVLLDEPDGNQVYVVMLHSREWLELHGKLVGGAVPLNLPRHGVHGAGRVTFVEPSPLDSEVEGRVMTFVRKYRPANGAKKPAPTSSPFSRQGVRTYFGEALPPIGQEWLRVPITGGGSVVAAFTLTRPLEWWHANEQALEVLRSEPTDAADGEPHSLVRLTVDVEAGQRVHIAFFWPTRWVQVHGLTVGEPLSLLIPGEGLHGEGRLGAIEPAPFVPHKGEPRSQIYISGMRQRGHKNTIETAEVGDYAITYTAEERGEEPAPENLEGAWVTRQRVRLHLEKEGGGEVKVVLLRETEWVQAEGIIPGGSVYLDMPEQGTTGWARVQAVEPCLVFRRSDEPGVRMVTGTFCHSDGLAGDLKLKGESKPLGVTEGHLLWSVDRRDWVSVGELRPGETVKTMRGTTTVESYTMRDRPEPVYNMEVEHDHVYRVGDQGILAHNTSAPCCTDPFSDGVLPPETVTFAGVSRMRAKGVMGAVIPPATVMARVGQSGAHQFQRGNRPSWWADFEMANPTTFPDEWQRSHLLGAQLGGSGSSVWANMVPLHMAANKTVMAMCENRIADYIKACGDCVTYSATPVYSGDNLHPTYVLLEAISKQTKTGGSPVFRIRVRVYNQVNPPPRVQCQATGNPPACS